MAGWHDQPAMRHTTPLFYGDCIGEADLDTADEEAREEDSVRAGIGRHRIRPLTSP